MLYVEYKHASIIECTSVYISNEEILALGWVLSVVKWRRNTIYERCYRLSTIVSRSKYV